LSRHYCSSSISPAKFIKIAAGFNPCFHGYSQQDSMDFIRLLLDRFHEELKYSVPAEAFEDQSPKIRRKSGRLASKNNESIGSNTIFKSVISETFSGCLRSEVQCHKCKKVSLHRAE
jgi:ubiquitin C-terminal hydrolase